MEFITYDQVVLFMNNDNLEFDVAFPHGYQKMQALEHMKKYVTRPKKKRKYEHYYYLITFTLAPALNKFTPKFYDKVEKYIKKLVLNPGWQTLYCSMVREGGDMDDTEKHTSKHVHFHLSYVSKNHFDSKNVSYYKSKYGNVDISCTDTQTIEYSLKYINKQLPSTLLLDSRIIRKLDL